MLSIALDLCKSIIDVIRKNKEANQDSKIRISQVLEEISKIIEDTANKLSENIYPHMNCQLMSSLSNQLHFYMMDYLNNEDIDKLHKTLLESSNIEREFAMRNEPQTIPQLYSAAAEFKALSILIKL